MILVPESDFLAKDIYKVPHLYNRNLVKFMRKLQESFLVGSKNCAPSNVERCGGMWSNVEQCGAMWSDVGLTTAMWSDVERCGMGGTMHTYY